MNLLQSLLAALGLPQGTTEEAALTAVAGLKVKADKAVAPLSAAVATALGVAPTADEAAALSAIGTLKSRPLLPAAVATALGVAATSDETAALSAITALKAGGDQTTMQTIQSLQQQIAQLTAANTSREVTTIVDDAIKVGKLLPAQKEWAVNLGKTNLAQLSAFIKDAPVVAAGLGATQTQGDPGAGGSNAALSGVESTVLAQMGLSADEFKAGKA